MYYRSLNAYLRETFGCKVYKLALSAGCTCPNRDGTIGTRGCIFCSGSGEFAASASLSIPEQLAQAKRLVAAKAGPDARYIAYFQDFTNTYAPAEVLRPLLAPAIRQPEVCARSIATRPDCLPPEILSLLAELRAEKPVWVELGLQTIHASTAAYIRRGYPLSVYDEAVRALHARGISVITHQILGLPGETPEMMVETARYIGRSGADGIKLHLLHVLKGTPIERELNEGKFELMTLEDYVDVIVRQLEEFSPETVIQRLTGDGGRDSLIGPLWSLKKFVVLNEIDKLMLKRDTYQGKNFLNF